MSYNVSLDQMQEMDQAKAKKLEKSISIYSLSYETIEKICNFYTEKDVVNSSEKALKIIVGAAYRKDQAEKALAKLQDDIQKRHAQIAQIGCNYH